MNRIIKMVLIALTIVASSCKNQNKTSDTTKKTEPQIRLIRIESPRNGSTITKGDSIEIAISPIDKSIELDSITILVNKKHMGQTSKLNIAIPTSNENLGTLSIYATAWSGGKRQTASVSIFVKSNIVPKELTYRVIGTFNHDPHAYTQGLFFHNGFLYEGTGQNGASSIRKVELASGKVLQSNNLSHEHFGEGIALLNNKIYQLTWTSGIGFVYDLETFSNIGSFNYTTQGWGLTSNGKELIMSDGSNIIYFIEPESFTEIRRIEVYDNKGPVKMLNELEYIDGRIYANVYLTDKIVTIDPNTGAVTANIDFSGILKKSDRNGNEDVLNGIAYNPDKKQMFVTGKYWSKLFQVEIK